MPLDARTGVYLMVVLELIRFFDFSMPISIVLSFQRNQFHRKQIDAMNTALSLHNRYSDEMS